jgi:hypothetical protein
LNILTILAVILDFSLVFWTSFTLDNEFYSKLRGDTDNYTKEEIKEI